MLEDTLIKVRKLIDTGVEKSIPLINKAAKSVVEMTTDNTKPTVSNKSAVETLLSKKDIYTVTDTTLNLVKKWYSQPD